MKDLRQEVQSFCSYYRETFRPVLYGYGLTSELARLDGLTHDLEAGVVRLAPMKIGFLGESQVGKSSLVNALLDRKALPAGGLGPLTAQAIRVRWGDSERFEVSYHGRQAVNRLRFALEREAERQGLLPRESRAEQPEEQEEESDAASEAVGAEEEGLASSSSARTPRVDLYVKQARRMLLAQNGPEPTLPALVAGLREVLRMPPRTGITPWSGSLDRIQSIQDKLGITESIRRSDLEAQGNFDRALRLRAADWLSPLVRQLELWLAQPLLTHVDLVDLPGIGVVGDEAAQVAGQYIRSEADALVMVVRNNGMTGVLAAELESSDVLTRLNFDPHGLPLFVGVTHVDNVARSRHDELAALAEEGGDQGIPPLDVVFRELCSEEVNVLRRQLHDAFSGLRTVRDSVGEERARWEHVISTMAEQAEIHCVAAPEYLRAPNGLIGRNATGIEAMREALMHHAHRRQDAREAALRQDLHTLRAELASTLECVWGGLQDELRDSDERKRVTDAVDAAARPLQERLKSYQGGTQQFFRGTMIEVLKKVIGQAEHGVDVYLRRLIDDGSRLNVRSLQAAMRRRGIFEKRAIDYPGALTRSFVNEIAQRWQREVIEKVEDHLTQTLNRKRKLVEELLEGTRTVSEERHSMAGAILRSLKARSRSLAPWSSERFDKFQRSIHASLHDVVFDEFSSACEKAIAADHHRHTGAKDRILRIFRQAGTESISRAGRKAQAELLAQYDGLVNEIFEQVLGPTSDLILQAANALKPQERLLTEEDRIVRAQRLKEVEALRRTLPRMTAEDDA